VCCNACACALLRPRLFPFGKLSKAKPAAHDGYREGRYGRYKEIYKEPERNSDGNREGKK